MIKSPTFLLSILLLLPLASQATPSIASWNLPQKLNDQNTKVWFEVDSTWHMVHGTTSGVDGLAQLTEEGNPSLLDVNLELPVTSFNTDWEARDERMREVMQAEQFPKVLLHASRLKRDCTPAKTLRDLKCTDILEGELRLLKTSKKVEIPVSIKVEQNRNFVIEGKFPFKWAEYGIEDPSIFVARLNPTVTVFFKVTLPATLDE